MTTLVKICGLSTPETIAAAVQAGAAYVGLVHFPKSPRHVSVAKAAMLRRDLPESAGVVLLVVDPEPHALAEAIRVIGPRVVQFHGSEPPAVLARTRSEFGVEVWKALGVKDAAALDKAAPYHGAADRLLFDAPASTLPGGNGEAFDWNLLRLYRGPTPWGLAGGLTPANVAEAIRLTGAPLVDTSSGVERSPGIKDMDKIAAFCKAARL
ncbi:MAG: phosphoribosylanthranilate isomerase [Erythrobacter sp.]|jgi:phosphoribosylanthranilate isomerase|nr:phosphoribosylanthranilate isomerase [Erythrobacter sp.]